MLTISHPPINGTIAAIGHAGLSATATDGTPARLAIVDHAGHILDDSPGVAAAAWNATIECHRNFLIGKGHLRVLAGPGACGSAKEAA
jgi:hypothetical protein